MTTKGNTWFSTGSFCYKDHFGDHLNRGWGLDGYNVITVNILILTSALVLGNRISLFVGKSGAVGIRLATYFQIINGEKGVYIVLARFLWVWDCFKKKIKLLEKELLKFPLVACFNIKTNKQTLAQGLANITFLTNHTVLRELRGEDEGSSNGKMSVSLHLLPHRWSGTRVIRQEDRGLERSMRRVKERREMLGSNTGKAAELLKLPTQDSHLCRTLQVA